jgi:hypothetical protein
VLRRNRALEEAAVSKVNWWRVLLGGLVATVICFVTDGLMHNFIVEQDWAALMVTLGLQERPHEHGPALISFLDFELGRGLGVAFLYAMMRARYGPGPKTAVWAGIVIWLICSVSGPAQFIPLGFFSHALWLKAGAVHLVTTLAAALAGAALYRE